MTTAAISFKLIPGEENTWGYDIFKDGRLMVHQPTIPALPGNKGFKDKPAATRAANLVIRKIQSGQVPPTVTIDELRREKAID